ncbi:MAG TPA: glycosyltransferase [Stellaceae bacterium]|nr:glycosyltransferase [Stellaceae bacterium]
MTGVVLAIAALSLAVWLYLLLGRGMFWLPRELPPAPDPGRWPSVAALVPARNEADCVAAAIASLVAQDYPGSFRIVLVDDHSTDGTAAVARAAAKGREDRLRIVNARPLPVGWSGKLWALAEGVRSLEGDEAAPDLYLFTDADIEHDPKSLAELVRSLEADGRDLVSLMVLLRCRSFAERWLIPAFVFFFAMLYPFAWANDPRRRTAAAAGGCILMRRDTYRRVGGYAAIKGALIDDCALARAAKQKGGRIRLALTRHTRSLRAYPRVADVRAMVARTAYTQLHHSPLELVLTVLGLALVYLAPPALAFIGGVAGLIGGCAWALMTVVYLPMVRFYRLSPLWAPFLPCVAVVYLWATIESAWRHYRGQGGLWKGRVSWQSQR